jgi:hypothetical protein
MLDHAIIVSITAGKTEKPKEMQPEKAAAASR